MLKKIQLRRDTAANWASVNPILAQGEEGLETDTGNRKVGDGNTPWNPLAPWTPNTVKGTAKLMSIAVDGWAMPPTVQATSGTGTGKMHFNVSQAATGISALFIHWQNTGQDIDPAGPITFAASLEVISTTALGTNTGTLYPFTFGGRKTVTLDPGGKINADLLGVRLAVGDVVAVRTYLSAGTAYAPRTTWGGNTGGITGAVGGFTATTDLTAPGSAAIAGSNGNYYGPAALLGMAEGGTNAKSAWITGDSISVGAGDSALYTHPEYYAGFLSRALYGVAGALNVGVGGGTSGVFLGSNFSFRRWGLAHLCTSAFLENGSNGFYGSGNCAQEQANELEIATRVRHEGITKVFICTVVPRTTSTDGWATLANQTILSGNSERVLYNNWVRAGCPLNPTTKAAVAIGTAGALLSGQNGHPITGYFETADKVESSRDSGKWSVSSVRLRTGSIGVGGNVITSTDANFVNTAQEAGGDHGAYVGLLGAGASGGVLIGVATIIVSSTQVAIPLTATAAVTNAQLVINAMTADGTHPSGVGHNLMSQAINTALL